jgi:hypothetical protein
MPLSDRSRQNVARALARLVERASEEVPDEGSFEPIVERAAVADADYPVSTATLRIGAGQGVEERRRFLDVRIATDGAGSDSSTWLHFAPKAELLSLLRAEASGIEAVLAALESGAESLRRFQLK